MQTFLMKGNKSKSIYGAYSRSALEIRGRFHMQGPQPIGENGAPQWVADIFESRPDIIRVAVSTEDGGAVWSRMDEAPQGEGA